MTSDRGASRDALDERIAEARDSVLLEGESTVAQTEGDQGQGIVLTNSRVLTIKVGITATGTANGRIIGSFPFADIAEVNVRKGPLGAVIQIRGAGELSPGQGGAPDNVIVFTGSQRMKKCDIIAAKIEEALGRSVGRTEPPPDIGEVSEPIPGLAIEPVGLAEPAEPGGADASLEGYGIAEPEMVEVIAPGELDEVLPDRLPDDEWAGDEPEAEATPAAPDAEAEPEKPKGGREARSLADEMFAELMGASEPEEEQPPAEAERIAREPREPEAQLDAVETPEPWEPPATEVVVADSAEETPMAVDEAVEEDESSAGFRPNPNLPKPVRRGRGGGEKILVLLGLLTAALLVGVAATAPLREPAKPPPAEVNIAQLTRSPAVTRKQLAAVSKFQVRVVEILQDTDSSLAAIEAALRSESRQAVASAIKRDTVDAAWRQMDALDVPAGLVSAKETLVAGLFTSRTAIASLSTGMQSSGPLPAGEALKRIAEGRGLLRNGMDSIRSMEEDLKKRISELEPDGKPK